jgi:hypothetical protein
MHKLNTMKTCGSNGHYCVAVGVEKVPFFRHLTPSEMEFVGSLLSRRKLVRQRSLLKYERG